MSDLNFKVGDKVILKSEFNFIKSESLHEVVKITPSGRIRISDYDGQFRKDGRKIEKISIWDTPCTIRHIEEPELTEWKENERKISIIRKAVSRCHDVHSGMLDYETACKLLEILEKE